MATRRNPYRDPAIREGLNNIAGLFAPPSGQEMAGFATANARRQEADRLVELYAYAQNPNFDRTQFDRLGIAAGRFMPNQSFYSVDEGNAVARRGQDVTANTALATNRADNQRQIAQSAIAPLNEGQTAPGVSSVAQMYSIPELAQPRQGAVRLNQGQTAVMPDGRRLEGAPVPMSTDQVVAAATQGEINSGGLTNRQVAMRGAGAPIAVQTDQGPRLVAPFDAVGQAPATEPGRTVTMSDANGLPVIQNPDGSFRYTDGRPVPPDMRITNVPTPTGGNRDLGLGTPGNITERNRVLANVANADSLLNMYERILKENPGSIGIVGAIRGTAQNLVASGSDLARSFGNSVPQIQAAQNELRANLQSVTGRDMFDPSIPEAEFIQSTLAYSLARAENGGTDVSNRDFLNALDRVRGGGMLANSQSGLAAIGAARRSLDAARVRANTLAEPGGQAPVGANARPVAPGAPAAPQTLRFDRNGNMVQ
jgi:hypothetical protein